MKRITCMLAGTLMAGIGLGFLAGQTLQAQSAGIKRTLLLKTDLSRIEGREAIMGLAEGAPGVASGSRYHHGDEFGYVLEGTAVLEVGGQAPITLKAGEPPMSTASVCTMPGTLARVQPKSWPFGSWRKGSPSRPRCRRHGAVAKEPQRPLQAGHSRGDTLVRRLCMCTLG